MALKLRVIFIGGKNMPPVIEVHKQFKIAVENGNKVIEIEPGIHDVEERIADIAINHLQVAILVESSADADADAEQPEVTKPKRGKGAKNAAVSNEGTGQA